MTRAGNREVTSVTVEPLLPAMRRGCSRCSRSPPTARHRTRNVSQSSDALTARAAAAGAFDCLFLGHGDPIHRAPRGAMSFREQPAGNCDKRPPSEPRTDLAGREGRPPVGPPTTGASPTGGDACLGRTRRHPRLPLPPRQDPRVSYAWGRSGIGARELARALLFDATNNAALSERYCRDFTHEILAHLPEPEFVLRRDEILAWIAERPGQRTA
jgi:hypothetical protein